MVILYPGEELSEVVVEHQNHHHHHLMTSYPFTTTSTPPPPPPPWIVVPQRRPNMLCAGRVKPQRLRSKEGQDIAVFIEMDDRGGDVFLSGRVSPRLPRSGARIRFRLSLTKEERWVAQNGEWLYDGTSVSRPVRRRDGLRVEGVVSTRKPQSDCCWITIGDLDGGVYCLAKWCPRGVTPSLGARVSFELKKGKYGDWRVASPPGLVVVSPDEYVLPPAADDDDVSRQHLDLNAVISKHTERGRSSSTASTWISTSARSSLRTSDVADFFESDVEWSKPPDSLPRARPIQAPMLLEDDFWKPRRDDPLFDLGESETTKRLLASGAFDDDPPPPRARSLKIAAPHPNARRINTKIVLVVTKAGVAERSPDGSRLSCSYCDKSFTASDGVSLCRHFLSRHARDAPPETTTRVQRAFADWTIASSSRRAENDPLFPIER
ncbi:hypothetical protein CTAYLR_004518 [Chrysophaeum taylorii]|uniref:Uncharacterized protein n=1 Tax=Chrysophaeum taylorii TaxID=2483200 RepID=A0AAD7UNP9_9STRA|nr:hypothetical protein CTAYLR_004518 [Chrysophaeum taylorii]